MSRSELDQAIQEIRNEAVEDAVLGGAAKRVFAKVFDSTPGVEQVTRITGCADFRLLMSAYLKHTLSPARTLLLEDHTRQCVPCRKALREARKGAAAGQALETDEARESGTRSRALLWGLAAALTIGIGIGLLGARKGLLPGQHAVRGTVATVDGSLYRIGEFGARLVAAGEVIRNADELRTAKGSRAILRLVGGTRIELAERSDVSISGGWKGANVSLDEGRLIVESQADQGNTYVSSGGIVIPVNDAILAVDSGIKGSRITVAKGLVRVQQGRSATDVSAGQEFASDYRIGTVPLSSQFAWSQNANSYAALLNEFASLQKQFQSIPSPGLRYSSDLAKYVPANTIIYAAIPNLGGTLTEAKRIFDEHISQSDVLREWWTQQPASRAADFDRTLIQLASVSQYLGNELVIAVPTTGTNQYGSPVFVAEVRQPGLNDYLQQNVPSSAGLRIVTGTSSAAGGGTGQFFVETDDNIVVASPDVAELQTVEAAIRGTAATTFAQTPFYTRIIQSYSSGIGFFLAADMEQIAPRSVNSSNGPMAGFNDVQYLVLDRRDAGGSTETRATLSFAGDRQGMASWLRSPGPIGSIGFVSPDASLAVAVVMKNPRDMATELITFASQGNSQFLEQLRNFESVSGVSLLDDVASPLGGDAMFAVDGPLLPVPTWKFAVEVNDSDRLQNALSMLVSRYNQTPGSTTGKLELGSDQVGSRTFYSVRSERAPGAIAYYTFVDGYLLASDSEAALNQAMQGRQTGYTLVNSSNFRNQLPADNSTNFSAIFYSNLGSALDTIASQVKGSHVLSPAQQQSMAALVASTGPGLICLYGESDGIVAETRNSFLGFNLGTLAGIAQGKPMVPLIAARALAIRPGAVARYRHSKN